MRIIRNLGRYPIAVLGLLALGFAIWLWRDAQNPPSFPDDGDQAKMAPPVPGWKPGQKFPNPLPMPPPPAPIGVPQDFTQAVAKLKPGMTRAEVEELVGLPAPSATHPVKVLDGKVTYQTTYEADVGPPPTIRPITPRPHGAPKAQPGRTVVTLEFDATKPGHPLLGIHCTDPLF